jgi:hypothetical protein
MRPRQSNIKHHASPCLCLQRYEPVSRVSGFTIIIIITIIII